MRFFGGKNKIVLKLKFKIRISAFVYYCKRKLCTNFHPKKIWNFLKMKTLTRVPKFWIWTSKIMPDLWLLALFCPIKKKFHTPPYWAGSAKDLIRLNSSELKNLVLSNCRQSRQGEASQFMTTGGCCPFLLGYIFFAFHCTLYIQVW